MPEKNNLFYVGIRNPTIFRKELLVSSKKLILNLKRYEDLKALRTEKIETALKLKTVLKELNFLNNKLKSALPKTSVRVPTDVSRPSKRQAKTETEKASSEIERLEYELSKIESKLGTK